MRSGDVHSWITGCGGRGAGAYERYDAEVSYRNYCPCNYEWSLARCYRLERVDSAGLERYDNCGSGTSLG